MWDSDPPPEPALAPALPATVRHVIAVGGGRSGVGTSTFAVNLAVYLAQLGRHVLLVDANPSGAALHTMVGAAVPVPRAGVEDEDEEQLVVETPVPGLALLPQVYARGSTVPPRPGRKPRWAKGLRQQAVDAVVLDLGGGTSPSTIDLFLAADVGVTVCAPEPVSVEATYRFMKALFYRKVRRSLLKDRFKLRLLERAQDELPPLPSPAALVRALARYDGKLARSAAGELSQLRPRLVVNGTRLRADGELGGALHDMALRYLGVDLDFVGHVEHDDSVWLALLRQRPVLIDSPTSKSARNMERIARRLLALATTPDAFRPGALVPLTHREPNLYEFLWTHRGATDEEVRRAFKRQRELYQASSLPLVSLLDASELAREQARLDEAYDTLLDPARRRAYDASTFPDEEDAEPARAGTDRALVAEREMLLQELSRELTPETTFTGALLAKVRQARGVELAEIAERTKIGVRHLQAIEDEDFEKLPAAVYTRGFVQQLARYLELDPLQVSRTFLQRMRDRGGAPP